MVFDWTSESTLAPQLVPGASNRLYTCCTLILRSGAIQQLIDGSPLYSKNPVELHTTPLHITLIPRSNLSKYQCILAREASLVLAIRIRDTARSTLKCHDHVLADFESIGRNVFPLSLHRLNSGRSVRSHVVCPEVSRRCRRCGVGERSRYGRYSTHWRLRRGTGTVWGIVSKLGEFEDHTTDKLYWTCIRTMSA
ncbi:hypothetical protein BDV11DRAFT_95953 [Aspergillus similis]